MRRQLITIHPKPHGVTGPADIYRADPRYRLNALNRKPLNQLHNFQATVALRSKSQGDDRISIGIRLSNNGVTHLIR